MAEQTKRRCAVPVVWRQRAFAGALHCRTIDAAARIPTIAEIIAGIPEAELPRDFADLGEVRVNGEVVPRGVWHLVRPRYRPDHETVVTLHIPLGGPSGGSSSSGGSGKSTGALVATIAVLLVAAVVSAGVLGLGSTTLFGATISLNALAGAAIGCGGPLEPNAKWARS